MASTRANSRLRKNLRELETEVDRMLQNPTRCHRDPDLITYRIRQKIAFIRKLLALESASGPPANPEYLQEIADRLSAVENDFVGWAASRSNEEPEVVEEEEACSSSFADVEEIVSGATEEKFREELEVILSGLNHENFEGRTEKRADSQETMGDEFKATLSEANLGRDDALVGRKDEDQERVGGGDEHEDKETCYEEKIIEDLGVVLSNANPESTRKDQQEEDPGEAGQEKEHEERETCSGEDPKEGTEVREEDQGMDEEDRQHSEKETCCKEKNREELVANLLKTDLEKIVAELIERANKRSGRRRRGWLWSLGVTGAVVVATVGLAIAVFRSMEEPVYFVPT